MDPNIAATDRLLLTGVYCPILTGQESEKILLMMVMILNIENYTTMMMVIICDIRIQVDIDDNINDDTREMQTCWWS